MSAENGKVCCNCRHNIRTYDNNICRKYVRCYCDIDKKYMSYAQVMEGWCWHWASDEKKWKEVKELINNSPPADVRENVHGEWKDHSREGYYTQLYCSICFYESIERTNYCPNCGADMRKGETNG